MNNSWNETQTEYDGDYNDEICEKGMVLQFGAIVTPVFFSIVITLSLTGNILVLVLLARYENLKSLTNIFVLNLAISDIIFTASLPFWAIYHVSGWLFSENICKIMTFVFFLGYYSGIIILGIMTVYRYLSVIHLYSDLNSQSLSKRILVSVLIWMFSVAAALPSLLFSSLIEIHSDDEIFLGCEYSDTLWQTVGIIQQNVSFVVAFEVMGFCYIQILLKIKRTRSRTKDKALHLIVCVVAAFFVGWVPYNLVIALRLLAQYLVPPLDNCKTSTQLDYAFYVSRVIAYSHCFLNPILYVFNGMKFRGHLRSLLQQIFRQ